MTKRKSLFAVFAFVLAICLTLSMGSTVAYAAEDNLPPTIVAVGGNTVKDGIGTLPSAIMGEPYKDKDGKNYKIVATGTAPFEYKSMILGSDASMPAGLTLNSETGEISGTPTVKGEFRITISVKNSFGSASVLGVIRIFHAEDKPVIKTETIPNGGVGSQYYQRIEFEGYNQFYFPTLTDAPSWLKIVAQGASPCLTGTPTEAGTFTFTVNIDNTVGIASKEYTLKINDAPIEPKIEKELFVFNDSYSKFDKYGNLSVVQGKEVDIQFVASGTNTTGNPLLWGLNGTLPPGLLFDTNTGRLTGKITEDVVGGGSNKYYYCSFIAKNTNSAGSISKSTLSQLVVYKNGWKESVSITPDNTTVQKDGSRKFSAVVDGWGDVEQAVTWVVEKESNLSANTKIDENGNLTVGSDETNTEIKVVAITYNGKLVVKGEAVVTIVDHAHNTVKVSAKAKSCTENGNIEHFKCTVCNGLFSDAGAVSSLTEDQVVIPADHEYGTIVAKVAATCVATGTQAHYECSVCHKLFDESKTEKTADELTIAINPNGHVFGELQSEKPATCVATGTKEHKDCTLCHKHFAADGTTELADITIAVDGNAHNLATEWTATKDGHYHVCKNGCTVGHDEIKAHNPDRAAATETDPVKCTVCDYIIAPTLGHTHHLTAVLGKGATCTEDGRKTYYACDGCGLKFKDEAGTEEITDESWLVIPKAHRFGEWVEEVSATTEATGSKAHKDCEFCHKHFDEDGNEIVDLTIAKLSKTKFAATIENGTGGGEFEAGQTVTITTGEAPEGMVFDKWVVVSGSVTLEDANSATTTFVMPSGAVEIKATYKDKTPGGGEDNPGGETPGTDDPSGEVTPTETKGLNGGAIAGIAIGSAAVVGIGGFAIFWFAIKKKSFAELIAAIKGLFKKK